MGEVETETHTDHGAPCWCTPDPTQTPEAKGGYFDSVPTYSAVLRNQMFYLFVEAIDLNEARRRDARQLNLMEPASNGEMWGWQWSVCFWARMSRRDGPSYFAVVVRGYEASEDEAKRRAMEAAPVARERFGIKPEVAEVV